MSAGFWKPTVRLRARAAPSAVRTVCWRPNCYERGVPLEAVENALTLAAARRLARPADAPPLGDRFARWPTSRPSLKRSCSLPAGPEYFRHLRSRIARLTPAQ